MKAFNTMKSKIDGNLSIVFKRMHNILIASLFTISMILVPLGTATAQAVKWYPGHYLSMVGEGHYNSTYMEEVYNELERTPALRGIMVRYAWGELETAKDVYDFSNISKLLTELAARNKRLVILFETKASIPGSDKVIVPNYMKASAYEGGLYPFTHGTPNSSGYGIKLWNAAVHNRMISLIRALGNRFNSHPNFQGIGFTETSIGDPLIAFSNDRRDTYFNNLLDLNKQMRVHFPNTMTFQYANFPRQIVKEFVDTFKVTSTALGGPDVFLDDAGLWYPGSKYSPPGAYTYYPKLSGTLPLVIQVERSNYLNTRFDNTGYKPTVNELFTTARDKLDVNYMFWVRSPGYYPKVLEMLNQSAQKSTPSGGLKSACPTAYPSCKQ
ncbi:MAG: glycoside hydrolase [Nitrosomonas sp.]|nr:glycoside hydrolase [Nitrosomonas sp.]